MGGFIGTGPNLGRDTPGSVYVLKRAKFNGPLTKDLLFKIGYTRADVWGDRIQGLANDNSEAYEVVLVVRSVHPRFLEYQLHRFF